jgi:hypothetical protein
MFGHTWYFSTMRKYVILFGTLFNDIHITRTNAAGVTVDLLKVPLSYSAKEKMLARLENDPEIQRQAAILLPRMSFEMTGISYDQQRKLNTLGRISAKDSTNPNKLKYQYNPVPYNFDFKLSIYVKNAEDGTKILEQILPFFTPDWTATVALIPEMNINMDIPVILNNVSVEDSYEGKFEERRALIWTLNFTLKGYIYGPVKKSSIIKFANTSFYIPDSGITDLAKAVGNTSPNDRVTVSPGLDANGDPTSNASISINRDLIEVSDDFGYVTNVSGIILSE